MRALTDATAGLLKPIKLQAQDRLELTIDNTFKKFKARVFAETNGSTLKRWPSSAARLDWQGRIPERKELDGADTWELAATDYTAEIVNACWPISQIVWTDERTKVKFLELLLTTTMQDSVAELYAAYKETGKVPDHSLEMHPQYPLEPYQQAALVCALKSTAYNLFMEQGTGKTAVVIGRVMNEVKKRKENGDDRMYRALVICPKNVRRNWQREFERFATRPGKVEVIKGGFIKRTTKIIETLMPEPDCDWAVCVMSYEGMTRSWDVLGNIEWDLGVLDEEHYIKRPETKRTKYAMQLRDKCATRMGLTGTPISNSPLDIYSLFEFLGEGWSGFQQWKAFKDFYGVFAPSDNEGHSKLVAIQNKPFMQERLTRTSYIISKKEALPYLPDKVYDVIEAEMSSEAWEAYEKMASEMLLSLEDELDSSNNKSLTINNILTKLLRLAQVCTGYVVWDEVVDPNTLDVLRDSDIEFFKSNPKLDELVDQLKAKGPNEKTIVWSCFVPAIKQVAERLEREGIKFVTFYGGTKEADRLAAEDAFNGDPSVKVCIANPAAGGTGLNLLGYPPHGGDNYTTDCDHHIYYACNWSYVQRAQSEDRSHRRGTRKTVRISDLVVPETIDEDIRVRVMEKKLMAIDITDVREILRAVIHGLGQRGNDDET